MHRLNSYFSRVAGFSAAALLLAGCLHRHSPSIALAGCWTDNPPADYIIRTAANSIIGDRGAGGPRIRALAAVPLNVDSIRGHSQLVSDPAVCARVWHALDADERQSRIAIVQVGRTYWVRVPNGYRAFDDSYRLLTAIVDL
jgi:hypothetical protein